MSAIIVPAILTDNEKVYEQQLKQAENACTLIQIDIIDGQFAKNTTIGTQTIAKYPTNAQLEIQLMVSEPKTYIEELAKIDYVRKIIFPFEIEGNIRDCLYQIKNHKKMSCLSINPSTPLSAAADLLDNLDMLLVMSVEPGFSGQRFDPSVLLKIKQVKKQVPGLSVEIDGGVSFENIQDILDAGTDFVAANSVIYKAPDFFVAYEKLAKIAQ